MMNARLKNDIPASRLRGGTIDARLKNDVPDSRLFNDLVNIRVFSTSERTQVSTIVGSPIGLLLSLTYAVSSVSLSQIGERPTGRIFNL